MGKESILQTKILNDIRSWDNSIATKLEKASDTGWPDIISVVSGLPVFVETKSLGKKPDPHQVLIHEKLRASGALVFVCDTIEEWLVIRSSIYMRDSLHEQGVRC
jgi:hypothetical protein